MRVIVNYIRSLFCKHEWEYLGEIQVWGSSNPNAKAPHCIIDRWRCTKCGYIMKSKVGR